MFVYNKVRAEELIQFFEQYLVYIDGPLAGQPIKLRDWQKKPLREIYGRMDPETGKRQIHTAFIQWNKKHGKTEIFAAGVCLYAMTLGSAYGARVYAGANSRDQAAEIYNAVEQMVRMSEKLHELGFDPESDIYSASKKVVFRPQNSFFQALAAEAGPLHGKKPTVLVVDEIHAMKDRRMIDALREGMGTIDEPFTLYITNMGEIGASPVFWEEKKYADEVLKNPEIDPGYYAELWEAPAHMTDDELLEEGPHWKQLNPGLGDFMSWEDIRRACREAKKKPQQRVEVLRLRLGRPTQPVTAWIPIENWRACKVEDLTVDDLIGRECYAGLDLSSKWDFSALCLVFPEADGGAVFWPYAYIPKENAANIERITGKPIRDWVKAGKILETEGNVIDLDFIENHIRTLSKQFRIRQLAFDPRFAEQITQHIEQMGITRVEFNQSNARYTEPCQEFERIIGQKSKNTGKPLLKHDGNPVFEFCIESTAIKVDPGEGFRPVKITERKTDSRRIDMTVAAVMGWSLCMSKPGSVYQSRGALIM